MALAGHGGPTELVGALGKLCEFAGERINVNRGFIETCFYSRFGTDFGWSRPNGHEESVRRFRRLFGPMRSATEPLEQRHRDFAFAAQAVLESVMLDLCSVYKAKHGAQNLCLAGGVALNVSANMRIVREAGFKNVFIQPAAGDEGQAIGHLFHRMYTESNLPRSPMSVYLGPGYTEAEIANAVNRLVGSHKISKLSQDDLCDVAARELCSGRILAWYQGRSEIGPRALGNRSILASAGIPEMRDRLNRLKHRETFQPFAIAIIAERAPSFFQIERESPFMLLAPAATSEGRRVLPAGIHADGTSRVQTVSPTNNPLFRKLLESVERCSGLPGLLNTSFNDKGELNDQRTIGTTEDPIS